MSNAEACMSNLADLAKLSKRLNEQSDQANQILKDLEQKLVAMNLGVEAWVQNHPMRSKMHFEDGLRVGDDEVLGFGRFRSRYALLVKTISYRYGDNGDNDDFDQIAEGEPRLLRLVSRQLRVAALEHIEHLLDALEKEAQSVLNAIEKGRKTVDNL